MHRIWLGALVCLLGAVGVVSIFNFVDWSDSTASREEMLLGLFSFSLSTVLVGGTALLYDAITKRNDHLRSIIEKQRLVDENQLAEARNLLIEEQKNAADFLFSFSNAYKQVKFVRRELRSEVICGPAGVSVINAERYRTLIRDLSKSQLELEKYRLLLQCRPAYLSFLGDKGLELIEGAECYLRKVIWEYEANRLRSDSENEAFLVVDENSRLFQYTASRASMHYDGSASSDFFSPLDEFFSMLVQR